MGVLAKSSITSAISASDCPIYIGTDSASSISKELDRSRIEILELEVDTRISAETLGSYQDFNSDLFYRIVQYKWKLLIEMFDKGFEYIIFSDSDVFWKNNPILDLISAFSHDPNKVILIQDATLTAEEIRLCMGFLIIRNSDSARTLVNQAYALHLKMSASRAKVGDDDVISEMYREPEIQKIVGRLPQISYPVGILLNLFAARDKMPGLRPNDPFIFHANFAIGLRRKYLLMRLFVSGRGIHGLFKLPINLLLFDGYLRVRLFIGTTKKKLRK